MAESKLLTKNYTRYEADEAFEISAPIDDCCTLDTSETPDFEDIGDGWNSHIFSHALEGLDVIEYLNEEFANTPLIFARVWHRKYATYTIRLKEEWLDDVEAIILHSNDQIQLYPGATVVDESNMNDYFEIDEFGEFGGASGSDGDYMISYGIVHTYSEI